MKVEFDEDTCIGMFQCVAEWDAFEEDKSKGKAVLEGSEKVEDGDRLPVPRLGAREV